jgi:hypothetical protein
MSNEVTDHPRQASAARTALQIVGITLAVLFVLAGLAVVGAAIFVAVAFSSLGSNK